MSLDLSPTDFPALPSDPSIEFFLDGTTDAVTSHTTPAVGSVDAGAGGTSFTCMYGSPTSTPETSSTALLMGLGVASLGFLRRKIVA